ncbi:hypothetical protein [Moorena sp. SIO4G3]|uniref:hypothetical protein n=1 Tax=Moorena sp. SIO4G3 TaxID=2607821 RepID=UPI00142BF511|nr:hypothetical protein [Moorena sp. SIO4G3]NEO78112.1 hypothetical protein [Moorena sp. SIO4G3]
MMYGFWIWLLIHCWLTWDMMLISACHTRLQQQGKTAVIPPKRNRTIAREYDRHLYKARHLRHEFLCPTQAISRD